MYRIRRRLVLGSGSPRRRELLTLAGLAFDVHVTDVPEEPLDGEAPAAHALRLARDKARVASIAHPDAVAIGADTIVVVDRQILGKPRDAAAAQRMLLALAGRRHEVLTGFALAHAGSVLASDVVATEVEFRTFGEAEARAYVATGESLDKAGAYGIQGHGAVLVRGIHGSYTNVVGLPLVEVLESMLAIEAIATDEDDP